MAPLLASLGDGIKSNHYFSGEPRDRGRAFSAALGAFVIDAATLDPTDIVPVKWATWGVILAGAAT